MSRFRAPLILRLPFAMADRHLQLRQVLAAERSRSWTDSGPLLAAFALSQPEQRFVRALMKRKRNYWLFRCNQRAFCGDFVAVDMSANQPWQRAAVVIELKTRTRLRFGGGGAGNQLTRVDAALAELVEAESVITRDATVTVACGDGAAVLAWIRTGRVPN